VTADRIGDAGHQIADAAALAHGLEVMETPVKVDEGRLAACRKGVDTQLTKAFAEVETFMAAGRKDAATKALVGLDARFGGLAAPRSIDLAEKLAAP
jgi:hypothetical protein